MPKSTSFDFPIRDTAVRMELTTDISQSDTTLPVSRVVGFNNSDTPFLVKIWARQSGEFREDFIEYAVATSVNFQNNSLEVRRNFENTGAVSASQGDLVQPMVIRASDIDDFGEKRLDKIKLAVDTGEVKNVTSDSADFEAQLLAFDSGSFDENSASIKFEYGQSEFSNVFWVEESPSNPQSISSRTPTGGFDGSEVSYSPLTQASGDVHGVAIGEGYVAYCEGDQKTYVHNLSDGSLEYTFTQTTGQVNGVAIGEGYVAYGGFDDQTYVHNLSDGSLEYTLSSQSSGNINSVSINGGYVVYGTNGDNNAYVHNLSDGSLKYTLSQSSSVIYSVSIDGGYVAYGGDDKKIYVHDLADKSLVYTLSESSYNVRGVAIGNEHIAYGSEDDNTYVYNLSDGSLKYTLSESSDSVRAVDINEKYIVYGGLDNEAHIHNLSDGSLEQTLSQTSNNVFGVAIDERYVAYGGEFNKTYVHNGANGNLNSNTQYQYRAVAEVDNAKRKGRVQTFKTAP